MESGDGNNVDDWAWRSRRKLTNVPKPSMHLTAQDGEKNQFTPMLQKKRTEKQTQQVILVMSDWTSLEWKCSPKPSGERKWDDVTPSQERNAACWDIACWGRARGGKVWSKQQAELWRWVAGDLEEKLQWPRVLLKPNSIPSKGAYDHWLSVGG